MVPHKNKLDSIHGQSSLPFKDKLWFQTKRKLQMLFLQNQCINIVYPKQNYAFFLAPHKKKLDSIDRRSSSHFKDKLLFQTKWRLQMIFSRNQFISILYPNENYPFVLALGEKKQDSIHGRNSSRFKDKVWFQTKESYKCFFVKPMHQYRVS